MKFRNALRLLLIEAAGAEEPIGGNTPAEVILIDPKNCFDDKTIGQYLLSQIDWAKAEPRGGDNGEGKPRKTTTAHSFQLEQGGNRYAFSISVNQYPLNSSNGTGMTAKEQRVMNEAAKIMTQVAKRQNKDVADVALEHISKLK